MKLEDVTKLLDSYDVPYYLTGSNYICNPPVNNTDIDILCYIDPDEHQLFVNNGFSTTTIDNLYQQMPDFISWKNGNINIITVCDRDFYERFVIATKLARKYNLTNKADRVELFQAILYSKNPSEELTHGKSKTGLL